jgi:cell division protein FtsN
VLMSNNRPRAVDSKHKSNEALNVADFKIDDILNVPGDQLLAEVAEDFGDPAFLAAQFDSIALLAVASRDRSGVNRGRAMATFPVQPAASGVALVRALPRRLPWSFSRAALATLAKWPVVPLRRRIFLGAFATLLLVVALTPGIYPLVVNQSSHRITSISEHDPHDGILTQLPAPTSSGPSATWIPAPGRPARQSPVVPEKADPLQQPPSVERKQLGTATDGSDQSAGLVPNRRVTPLPSASVAPRGRAPQIAAATPLIAGAAGTPPAAKPGVTEGDGFFVQLSATKTEAEALATLRALKSKYAVLKGHEPVIRRKDEGERGVTYRVQVGPFDSQDDADQLCKALKTAGRICFVTRN